MNLNRRIVTILAATIALGAAAPALAAPDTHAPIERPKAELVAKRQRPRFPATPEKLEKHIAKRLAGIEKSLDKVMTAHKLPAATRAQIKLDFDKGAAELRKLLRAAGADGKLTKKEAKELRKRAKQVRREMRDKTKATFKQHKARGKSDKARDGKHRAAEARGARGRR